VLAGLYILHLVLPFVFFIIMEVLSWYNRQRREEEAVIFTILGRYTLEIFTNLC
jgi:hypothetical protein